VGAEKGKYNIIVLQVVNRKVADFDGNFIVVPEQQVSVIVIFWYTIGHFRA